ncbi:hypothetical protein LCGC14_1807000 [marine sediment metagenome]|uniref:Uncharacterized protein n=1 Tax=marine sediment metagenome TaxID=412755 RepID=A0A0F9J2H5_9ZZZZ
MDLFDPKISVKFIGEFGISRYYCQSKNNKYPKRFSENGSPCKNCPKINGCRLWNEEFTNFYEQHKNCVGIDNEDSLCHKLLIRPSVFIMRKAEEMFNMMIKAGYNPKNLRKISHGLLFLCCTHYHFVLYCSVLAGILFPMLIIGGLFIFLKNFYWVSWYFADPTILSKDLVTSWLNSYSHITFFPLISGYI